MSWSRGLGAVAALALAAGLAGCFQPLYGEAAHPGLVEDVRAIEVAPIRDRIGHYLGDDLTSDLNGTGQTPPPKYRLTVKVSIGTQTPTVNSEINVATSATVTGEAEFTLNKVDGGAEVLKGKAAPRRPTTAPSSATTICAPRATPRSASPARFRRRFRCASPRRSPERAREALSRPRARALA